MQVIKVVRCPRREEFRRCYRTQCWMFSPAPQIARLEVQRSQFSHALAANDGKLIEQLVQRFSSACLYLSLPVKRIEGPRFAILQNSVQTWQPVCAVGKDKVSYDVECVPRRAALVPMGPRIGQSSQ